MDKCFFWWLVTLITIFWINSSHSKPQKRRLSPLITHYEPVFYDNIKFHKDHHITKRSVDLVLDLNFHAFGQYFPLRLKRDIHSVAHDISIDTGDGSTVVYIPDSAYKGIVEDIPESYVFGVIHSSGLFEGTIMTAVAIYKIEPASKYDLGHTPEYHSIIYRDQDIEYNKINSPSLCDSDKLHEKVKDQLLYKKGSAQKKNRKEENRRVHDDEGKQKYYQAPRDKEKHGMNNHEANRKKRAVDDTKKQCTLYIEADHKYYQYWGTDEAVINEITVHVQAANAIYNLIDFDEDGTAEEISFIVKRIKLWKSAGDTDYKFPDNYDVATYLQTFSIDADFDEFCLAYIYTYRDFDGGTLGLAWTGSTTTAGGVCERMAVFSGVQKALNAGLITILNYGEVQPHLVSFVTFAHELGHNFGSPHDEDGGDCAPGGDAGNYIMYPKATDGNKPNNNKFSACSIANMHAVTLVKGRDSVDGCFQVPVTTICGNGVIEDGEECDCGYDTECTDTCCNPQVPSTTVITNTTTPCTLTANSECSPSQGFCCHTNCTYISANSTTECRASTGCTAAAECTGVNSTCPASIAEADGVVCSASKVCQSGACTGSLCLKYNMTECQCEPATELDYKDEILCQLCCAPNTTESNDTYSCTSSYSLSSIPNTEVDAGTACMNFLGYCDTEHVCREVVPDGILTAILNADNLKAWLKSNWYFPVAGLVVVIIGIVVMVKFCTPKKKTDKKKEKKDKKSKVGPSSKKGPAPRRDQALTPPKAKPYKLYDNPPAYGGQGGGYPAGPGGYGNPGGPPGGYGGGPPGGYGGGYGAGY